MNTMNASDHKHDSQCHSLAYGTPYHDLKDGLYPVYLAVTSITCVQCGRDVHTGMHFCNMATGMQEGAVPCFNLCKDCLSILTKAWYRAKLNEFPGLDVLINTMFTDPPQ